MNRNKLPTLMKGLRLLESLRWTAHLTRLINQQTAAVDMLARRGKLNNCSNR